MIVEPVHVKGLCLHRGACWAALAGSRGLVPMGALHGSQLYGLPLHQPGPPFSLGLAPNVHPHSRLVWPPSCVLCPRLQKLPPPHGFDVAHLLLTFLLHNKHCASTAWPAHSWHLLGLECLQPTALGSKPGKVGVSEGHQPADPSFHESLQIIMIDRKSELEQLHPIKGGSRGPRGEEAGLGLGG